MKNFLGLMTFMLSISVWALEVGDEAPDFKLVGARSKEVSLQDLRGKIVVLEWLNHGCPFVKKHYGSGNMQALQKKYVGKDVVWLSIISSAEGKQGYEDQKSVQKLKYNSSDVLMDPTGEIGKKYGAKTTPHMFIIDTKGKLIYQGAIDDRPDTDQASIKTANNFVASALDELLSGKNISVSSTKAYGCSIKY